MQKSLFSLAALLILLALAMTQRPYAADEPAQRGLAGAQPEIDAARFHTLQAALDAVPETGGLVRLPAGTFEIHEPLTVSTPETRIEGSGAATHIKNLNESGQPAIILRSAKRNENPRAMIWRLQLGNFRISGNEKSGDGVHAEGINEVFIQGLSVDHHGGHGIALVDCYEDPRVSDSILTYNGKAGLYIDGGHDIVVNANQFEENQDALVCVDGYNLCMNGNNLDDHLRHGVVIENTYGSVVSGNMIEECNGTAIILDRDCYGITLSANVIAHDMGGGVDLRDAHGCSVSANTFTLLHHFSVRVGSSSGRITISANNFSNSHIGGEEKRQLVNKNVVALDIGHGIILDETSHVTVSGNTFSGLDGPAVKATGSCQQVLVSGNVVTDIQRRADGGPAGKPAFDIAETSSITLESNLAR